MADCIAYATPGTCGNACFRTQDRAHSLTRPLSGHPSHYSKLQTPSSILAQPRKPVTGVAGKGIAPVHCIPHQGSRGTWKQGCFQPPWASMRRKPGVASAPPSDWGWVALNVDQVWSSCMSIMAPAMLCLFACHNIIMHCAVCVFSSLYQVTIAAVSIPCVLLLFCSEAGTTMLQMSDAGQFWQGGMGRQREAGSESPVDADTRQYWPTTQVRLSECTCTTCVCFAICKNALVLTLT